MISNTQRRAILELILTTNLTPFRIGQMQGVSHNTVTALRTRAVNAGITFDRLSALKDSEISEIIYPSMDRVEFEYPNWTDVITYMEKGYNRLEAHDRYVDDVGIEKAITYSTFCKKLKLHMGTLKKVFRHIHRPGYAMQIDFAGYQPYGLENNIKKKFQLFVAVLPASSLTFAFIVRSQKIADHNTAIIRSFEYFGGVPEIVVSDNLKSAVIKWNGRHGPIINKSFLSLGSYYGFFPKPTRVAKPKDKAAVENAVKYVQRLLRLALMNQPLMDVHNMQLVLTNIIEAINNRKMQRRGKTRHVRFRELEKSYLLPLPAKRMTYIDPARTQLVKADYHIIFDNSYYSVPHRLTGLEVSIRANSVSIEISHDGQVVAIHTRSFGQYDYITNDQHRHPNHTLYNRLAFDDWLALLEENTRIVAIATIGGRKCQRDRERLISKVRNLIRLNGRERVEIACEQAIHNQFIDFQHVTNLLENNLEVQPVANDRGRLSGNRALKNIRGRDYFFPPKTDGEV